MALPHTFLATVAITLITLMSPSTWAQAAAKQGYIGLGLGQSQYRWTNSGASNDNFCFESNAVTINDCNDSPTGYKVFAGYNFNTYLGAELTYYRAGNAEIIWTNSTPVTLRQRVNLNGFGVSAVGTLPLGPAFVSARVGVAAATVSRHDDVAGTLIYRDDRSKTQPIFGLAIGTTAWRSLAVRLDWDRVRAVTAFDEKFEADLYTFNLMYRFE